MAATVRAGNGCGGPPGASSCSATGRDGAAAAGWIGVLLAATTDGTDALGSAVVSDSLPPNRRCNRLGRPSSASPPLRSASAWRCSLLSSLSRIGISRDCRARSSISRANCFSGLRSSRGRSRASNCWASSPRASMFCWVRCWRRCSESSTAFSRRGIRPDRPASMSSRRRISRSSFMHWSTALSLPSAARLLRTRPRRSRSIRASQRRCRRSCCSMFSRYLSFQRWTSSRLMADSRHPRARPRPCRAGCPAGESPPIPADGRRSAGRVRRPARERDRN